jgi:metallo-beta-lactamase class B
MNIIATNLRQFIKRWWLVGLFGTVVILGTLGTLWRSAISKNRGLPDEPFHIAGNLYYVGNAGITSFLITGTEGHVLIDGGYPESASAIMSSIAKLGFDIADVKILLNSHAHADHAGGLRALQEASGAALWISEGDADVIAAGGANDPTLVPQEYLGFLGLGKFPAPRIDHRFEDGEVIRLGPIELTAHITAGHTPGCTTWSFPVRAGDRELLAVNVCSLTLVPFVSLIEPETYPGIRSDYERSFSNLRNLPADIFLGSHSSWFNMEQKLLERSKAGDPVEPFIDRDGYLDHIDRAEARFREEVAGPATLP